MTPSRIIIVDQSLKDFDGHHYEYDLAVARAAVEAALDVHVLTHADFTPATDFPCACTPWFSEDTYAGGRGPVRTAFFEAIAPLPPALRKTAISAASQLKRILRSPIRPRASPLPSIGRMLLEGLVTLDAGPGDHVLVHTLSHSELQAVVRVLPSMPQGIRIHLVLRRDAEEADVVSDAWGGIPAALRQAVNSADVHLYADSTQLAAQYDALIGRSCVAVLPIPHCLHAATPHRARSGGPLRLIYLGNARNEKGFDQLPELAWSLRSWLAEGRVQLVAQSNVPVSLEEATMARCIRELQRYPGDQVALIGSPLSMPAFQELLFSADIVLLPYRTECYRRRSSGILVQAGVAGKPTVVPANSWLATEAPAGTTVTFGNGKDFANAVWEALEGYPQLARAAAAAAPAMRQRHSAEQLVHVLTQSTSSTTGSSVTA